MRNAAGNLAHLQPGTRRFPVTRGRKILSEAESGHILSVLDYKEAPDHPHNEARRTYIDINGVTQPAPAPRFSRTECAVPSAPRKAGADTEEVLATLGASGKPS